MNKKLLSIMLALSVLFVAGCAQTDTQNAYSDDSDHSYYRNVQASEIDNNDTLDPAVTNASSISESEVIKTAMSGSTVPQVISNLKLDKKYGDIKKIYYAAGNNVIISANKLILYDLTKGKVLAEAPQTSFERENVWVIDNGYVAFGETVDRGKSSGSFMTTNNHMNNNYKVIFYDQSLKKVSEFDFSRLLDGDDLTYLEQISFSANGNQVAYATFSGLYVYDFKKGKKTKLIDLNSDNAKARSGLTAFEQIGFTNHDKSIAFKAQSFDIPAIPGKPSFDTCGIVNTDGSGLTNQTFKNYTCKELTAYNEHLLLAEDFTVKTGRIMVMKTPGEKTKIHTLTEKAESGFVTGSDSGRYFATSVANKDHTGWKIRVYNTETGKLEAEQLVSGDGKDLYMARDPKIKVIDDLRTFIVLLGSTQTDIKTKVVVSQF